MLIDSNALKNYKLDCLEGVIGNIDTIYFDDVSWAIRYLVLNAGHWLPQRQVLISPHALASMASRKQGHFAVELTKKQIEDSPAVKPGRPPSRSFEIAYHCYYKWAEYWNGSSVTRDMEHCGDVRSTSTPAYANRKYMAMHGESDAHLRNSQEIVGLRIQAEDGETGYVEKFIIDTQTWRIRDIVVKTGSWWSSQSRLVSPRPDMDSMAAHTAPFPEI